MVAALTLFQCRMTKPSETEMDLGSSEDGILGDFLRNLLTNAIEFSNRGIKVKKTLRVSGNPAELSRTPMRLDFTAKPRRARQ